MREKKFTKLSANIFILFGSYNLLLIGLNLLRNSSYSLTSEARRVIGIIPWYADFLVYIIFFIGMLGLIIYFNNQNLLVSLLLCVPILIAALFKIINTISVMFSGPVPKISNFGLYFISIGMLFIGVILLWKKHVSFIQFFPFLFIASPLLLLFSPIHELLESALVSVLSTLFFGLGWILIGWELMKWTKNINPEVRFT